MLISDEKAFVFVHIEKTAGTSITSALLPHSLGQPSGKWASLRRAFGLPRDYHGYKFPMHGGLIEAEKKLPPVLYKRYYKFAFVRNPWDRLVSEYNAAIKKNRRRRHQKIKAMANFSEYVDYEIRRDKLQQHPLILNSSGEIGLDYTGRFENLVDDFNHVCETLDLEVRLEKLNAFQHVDYQQYYDQATQDKVRHHWARDIELLGYDF